jgi:thiol-disulfide isomerase/thioredoxin
MIIIFIAGLLAVTWYSKYAAMEAMEHLPVGTEVGQRAPDFTGTTVDGETVRLSDYHGSIVLINDFATWCGPCLFETPHLVEIYNAQANDIAIIGLNLQEDILDVADYQIQFGVTYPLVMDPDGRLTDIYRPLGLPTSWFIDEEGVIRYVHTGPMNIAMIEGVLDAVREGREPDVFSVAG